MTACRPLDGQQGWQLAPGRRGECPAGAQWAVPRHAKDNVALQTALQAAGASAAWLPLSGVPACRLPEASIARSVGGTEAGLISSHIDAYAHLSYGRQVMGPVLISKLACAIPGCHHLC